MASSDKSLFRRVVDAGCQPGLSVIAARHVRATNVFGLVGMAFLLLWGTIAILQGRAWYWTALENGVGALLFGSVPWLGSRQRPVAAILVLLATIHAQTLYAVHLTGFASGAYMTYLFAIVVPYLVYPRSRRNLSHVFALLGCIHWIAVVVFADAFPPRVQILSQTTNFLVNTALVSVALLGVAWGIASTVDQAESALDDARDRADTLLLNVLPPTIAERLKDRPEEPIADRYDEVSVLFADLVGFTPLSARLSPSETVELLNRVFSAFDELCERAGVEKIRTIGDGYMAVCGAPKPQPDHAAVLARVAIQMRDYVAALPEGEPLQIRIGINTGPAVGAIVGTTRFHFDLWGDAVNVAARMESLSEPGRIQITRATREKIHSIIPCELRGVIPVKGKGTMETWYIC